MDPAQLLSQAEPCPMHSRPSFAAYVAASSHAAADRLMIKARLASHLAKIVTRPVQRQLYELKCGWISRAMELAPARVVVDCIDRQGLIGITNEGNGVRLHMPASQLSARAQAVAHEQIARRDGLGLAAA